MKKKKIENKFPTVEIDTIMFYDGKDVYIKRLITNDMPFELSMALIEALNKTIKEYYDK